MAQDQVMLWKISSSFRQAMLRWHQRARLTALVLILSHFKPRWFVSHKQPLRLVLNASAALSATVR